MRILLLATSFNSLSQRLWTELVRLGHDLSTELDIHDRVTEEAVKRWAPQVVIAPFLKRAIPESVWRRVPCLVVHPGPPGDRGPSALDWAVLGREREWGVTVLQATGKLDGGPVRASRRFPMRAATKGSLYRREVTDAAVGSVLEALARFGEGGSEPEPAGDGRWRPLMKQAERRIDWSSDDTATVLAKIRSADGQPGVADEIAGRRYWLCDAHPAAARHATPGALLGRIDDAVLRATTDGSILIGHLKTELGDGTRLKLAAAGALGEAGDALPALEPAEGDWREIRYSEANEVGYLEFDFYNGAMSTAQCRRLVAAWRGALARPTKVLVLLGGEDFWSNGMDLATIEAATSPADESWANINAIDDFVAAVIGTTDRLTVAALRGNAGAGGAFIALAADEIVARAGVVLNPHYKNMGNLYGSEYWTYLLPRRMGESAGRALMASRMPLGAPEAAAAGLIDEALALDHDTFLAAVRERAEALARDPALETRIADKRRRRERDEAQKPLADYRREELEAMRLNFYGFDTSYHVARHKFVTREPHARTPLHLAVHRQS